MGRMVWIVSIVMLGLSFGALAQGTSLSLGTVSAQPGSSVSVPLSVANFNNVGAISLKVSYDPAVLSYTGLANQAAGVSFTANGASGTVILGWFDVTGSTPLNLGSTKLADLEFTYIGGSCPLSFITAQCEIADGQGTPLAVTYTDGAVSGAALPAMTLSIGSIQAQAGQRVNVAINAANFENVGAISLKIQFDPAVLTFNGLANVAKTGFNSNAASGVVTIGWFDQTGNTPMHLGTDKLLDLDFTYAGGSSQLRFLQAECEIADSTGTAYTVSYVDGSVSITAVPGETTADLPARFDLLQNYPNPFNPSTTIQYDLPKEAKVVLKLYNLIGEEIGTLVSAEQTAGRYQVRFDGTSLSSGVYLYKLIAGDFVSTKKLVLAK